MTEQEGVIKFQLQHQSLALDRLIDWQPLLFHRAQLYRQQLIGQQANRYGGLGYGNISQRRQNGADDFVISGSQTGQLPELSPEDFAWVKSADINHNHIESIGLRPPSSEALSHASIYQCMPKVMAVIHVHNPQLWHSQQTLNLPCTAADIAYGTVEMAYAIQALCRQQISENVVFCMLGHEDGVIAYGNSLIAAYTVLMRQFELAIAYT